MGESIEKEYTDLQKIDKNNSLLHLRIKQYGIFSVTKTVVSNFSDYTPNENEQFVLENSLSFSIPFKNATRKYIFWI